MKVGSLQGKRKAGEKVKKVGHSVEKGEKKGDETKKFGCRSWRVNRWFKKKSLLPCYETSPETKGPTTTIFTGGRGKKRPEPNRGPC